MAGFNTILYALTAMLFFLQEKTNDCLSALNFNTFRNILTITAPEVEFVTQTIRYTQTTTLSASTSTVVGPVTTVFTTTYRASATGATTHHDPTYMTFVDRNPWDGLLIFALLITVMTNITVFTLASRLRKERTSVTQTHIHQKSGLNLEDITAFWSRMKSTYASTCNTISPMWQASWPKGLSIVSSGFGYSLIALGALFSCLCWIMMMIFTHVMIRVYNTGPYVRAAVCWFLWDLVASILVTVIDPFRSAYHSWKTSTPSRWVSFNTTTPSRRNLTGTPRQPNHFSPPYTPASAHGRASDTGSLHETQALKNEIADLQQRLRAERDSHDAATQSERQLKGDLEDTRRQLNSASARLNSHNTYIRFRSVRRPNFSGQSSRTTEDRGVQTTPEDNIDPVAAAETQIPDHSQPSSPAERVPQQTSRPIKPRFNPKFRATNLHKRLMKSRSSTTVTYVQGLKTLTRRKAQVGALKQTLQAKDTEIKDLQQAKDAEISDLQQQLRDQSFGDTLKELDEKERQIDHLRNEANAKEQELRDAMAQKDAVAEKNKAQDNKYTEDLFEKEERIGQLEDDLEAKEQEMQEKDGKIAHLENDLHDKGKEVQSVKASLLEVQSDLMAKLFENLELQPSAEEKDEELAKLKKFARDGEALLIEAREELGALSKEFVELQAENQRLRAAQDGQNLQQTLEEARPQLAWQEQNFEEDRMDFLAEASGPTMVEHSHWSPYQFDPVDDEVNMDTSCKSTMAEQPTTTDDADMAMPADASMEGAQQEDTFQDNGIPGLGLLGQEPWGASEVSGIAPMHGAPLDFSLDYALPDLPAFSFDENMQTSPAFAFGQPTLTPPGMFSFAHPTPAPADHAMDMADDIDWASWIDTSLLDGGQNTEPLQNASALFSAGDANQAPADQTMEMDDDATPCGYTEASPVGGDLETAATEADNVDSRVLLLQEIQNDQPCEPPTGPPAETTNMEEGASSLNPSTGAEQEERTSAPTSYVPSDEDYEELEAEVGDLYTEPSSSRSAPAVPGRAILKPVSQRKTRTAQSTRLASPTRPAEPARAESPRRNAFENLKNTSPVFVFNPTAPPTVAVPVVPSRQFVPGPASSGMVFEANLPPTPMRGQAQVQVPAPAPVATSAGPVSRAPQTATTPAYHETAHGAPRLEASGFLKQMIADARRAAAAAAEEEEEEEESSKEESEEE
ncbi:hypothetical protein PV05_08213 [Exophiala xenobiotica]|uniref:Uncharacterized protein n=1 Tax=Exophiala xenobiotica TaxID=348802 RepID=A0A0D2EB75_9EURO|nr:uncharacterized protein PV05_08213 [Exophiala xenobiotica]KIW52583.1 hypothetical protein PV05_08213 [Exophiala xenobiotica]